jgi:putative phage-type endonuclease
MEHEQRSPEWFAARRGRVTGSVVGAILECAPYMTRDDAFRNLVRSMHEMPSEFSGNVATEYGTFNEAGALVEYQMETGNKVDAAGFVTFGDWLGASPDGYIGDDGLIEIKCPFGKRKESPPVFKSIDEQPHYYAQIQVQLYVTERDWCDFYQWSPHGTKTERVYLCTEWIIETLPILHNFRLAAKQADPADYEGPKRPVIDTPEAVKLVAEFDELADAIDNATARKKEVLAAIVALAGSRDSLVGGRKLTLTERKGSVAYAKAVAAIAPDADLEPYRGKPSSSWGLR